MSSGLGSDFRTGALVGSLVTATVALGLKVLYPQPAITEEKKEKVEYDDAFYKEQFARNIKFFGEKGQAKIEDSFVVIVGLGGVGSHAAHMLVRSGIGRVRLIDFDDVTTSSLNRHAVARQSDVGQKKVHVLKRHFGEICGKAKVEALATMFSYEKADELLGGKPDYVLDCIDNLETKVDLIQYCAAHNIPIMSSMGAGAKADISTIRFGPIEEAEGDDLAVTVRKGLRKRGVRGRNINVCYSTEKARMKLLPLEVDFAEVAAQKQAMPNFRVRVMPVLGTMPAAMGTGIASFVLCYVAGQPIKLSPPKEPMNPNSVNKLLQRMQTMEKKFYGVTNKITLEQMTYVINYIFRGRSCMSGLKIHPALVRWDASKPATLDNLILLSEGEVKEHASRTSLE
eukprot:Ihof_evm15s62 gene=Ihof_evmTU15s62